MSHSETCICWALRRCRLTFHPRKEKSKFPVGSSSTRFHTAVILSAVMLSSSPPVFFRSPSQAKERAGVFGAGVGPVGDPLVLQVQHFCGTGFVCGAAPLELWYPPQRGRSHRLGDRGSGRSRGDRLSFHIKCCSDVTRSFDQTFGIGFGEKPQPRVSLRDTCCSWKSAALR